MTMMMPGNWKKYTSVFDTYVDLERQAKKTCYHGMPARLYPSHYPVESTML